MHLRGPIVFSAAPSMCGLVQRHCLSKVDVGKRQIILDNDVIRFDISVGQALVDVQFHQTLDGLPCQITEQLWGELVLDLYGVHDQVDQSPIAAVGNEKVPVGAIPFTIDPNCHAG